MLVNSKLVLATGYYYEIYIKTGTLPFFKLDCEVISYVDAPAYFFFSNAKHYLHTYNYLTIR